MMKISLLTILLITGVFAQELEVEGSLKVIGEIDAQGNAITNVGNPTQDTDAVNLSTVRDMSGMKPERIYRFERAENENFNITVPEGKIWRITAALSSLNPYVDINNIEGVMITSSDISDLEFWLLPGDNIRMHFSPGGGYTGTYPFILNIFEYSSSGSGTDQGMDYIEP